MNKISDTFLPGIHAEHDAIRKLLPLKKKKKLQNINLLVIRLSGKNKIQSSKPCSNCIEMMKNLPVKLGYQIKDIYYSDFYVKIVKTNLHNLEKEEQHFTKFYRNKKN